MAKRNGIDKRSDERSDKGSDKRSKWHRHRRKAYVDIALVTVEAVRKDPSLLSCLSSMRLEDMPLLVKHFAGIDGVPFQHDIIDACLKQILQVMSPGSDHSPHMEQVRAVRRLVYGKGDTLLIARTGFGKSIILHSFSLLTRKITLQIVPLNKLGDQQLTDIRRFCNARPCLLNAENKRREGDLIEQIKAGVFTHVLLGPEQAVSKAFKKALSEPELQSKIGLVAIDECHLVQQWESFRQNFAMLGQLRQLLRQDVLWFGCSATLSQEGEQHVLQKAGFRGLGPNQWQTEVIRISVDRPDMFICVRPIPRRKLTSFETLYFLLDAAIAGDPKKATPNLIPKTIVFVDSILKIAKAADCLRGMLLSKNATVSSDFERYTETGEDAYSVYTIVGTFTSHVSSYDQDIRFDEFKKTSSKIRIMVATTSLGMGINVPDIKCIVTWNFPINMDLCDIWQRIGRGGRGKGQTSRCYILLPYWAFDTEGIQPPKSGHLANGFSAKNLYTNKTYQPQSSQLIESVTPGDISDVESVSTVLTSQSQKESKTRHWNKTELDRRACLPTSWKEIVNGSCHRKAFLSYLGENRLPNGAESIQTPREECCTRCNPTRIPPFTTAPVLPDPVVQPRKGTRAGFACDFINEWALLQAESIYSHPDRRFPMTSVIFMDIKCQWQLAALYASSNPPLGTTLDDIDNKAPLLREWSYREEYGSRLFEQLQTMVTKVRQAYADFQQRKRKEKSQPNNLQNQVEQRDMSGLNVAQRYIESVRKQDDTLAMQVARRTAAKSSEMQATEPSLPLSTPVEILPILSDKPSTPEPEPMPVIELQSSPLTRTSLIRRRRESPLMETPRKRRPLAEKDINRIVFTPVTKSGRVRTPTPQALDNFYIAE